MLDLFRFNCIAQIFLITAFLPLIKAGTLKKVVGISTGFAVIDLAAEYGLYQSPLYSISKTAFNMAIAKLHAEHKNDGVLIMAVAPGVVETGHSEDPTTNPKAMRLVQTFIGYAPDFKGRTTPDESAVQVLGVIDNATFERNGGKHVSQFGDEQWL